MSVVADTVAWVSELFAKIVNGLKDLGAVAMMLAGFGCQSGSVEAASAPGTEPVVEMKPITPDAGVVETGPKLLGTFDMTFYYVIGEDEVRPKVTAKVTTTPAPSNDNEAGSADPVETELAALAMQPNDLVPIYGSTCEPIADVSKEFANQLRVQGTGRLRDGRVLTVWGPCDCPRSPCFQVTEEQWGRSGTSRALQPFRTVAVDPKVVKLGSLLFVPALEGKTMPGRSPWGGFVHDGCVVADDTGGGIKNSQLDLFVGKRKWYEGLSEAGGRHRWARGIPVYDGTKYCQRKGRKVSRKSGAI